MLLITCTGIDLPASSDNRSDTEIIDVIVIAGQSNAVGFDTDADQLSFMEADLRTMFWFRVGDPPADEFDSTSGGAWTQLRSQPRGQPNPDRRSLRQFGNFAKDAGGFGPEVGLARAWHVANPGRQLAIVKAAFNGTRLAYDWQPDASGERGASYRALVDETRLAMKAAGANNIRLRLRALAWVQGEGDANPTDAPEYENRLRNLVFSLRRDLDAPELEILLAVNTRYDRGGDPDILRIIAAKKTVADGDSRILYVDTSSASVANRSHFDSEGMLEAGRLLGLALIELASAVAPSP